MTTWGVLSELPAADREALLASARRRRFAKGEILFHHGDPADSLHLLDLGHVAIRVRTPQGDQAILNVLGPGAVIGELALVTTDPHRSATVTAIDGCETLVVRRSEFDRLRSRYPGIDRFLLSSLAAQVERLSEHLLEVLFVPTKQRVIRRLVLLADTFGGTIPLTQGDLALMTGSTRPTVNETLQEIERTGAIRIGRGRIDVLDRRALARRLTAITDA